MSHDQALYQTGAKSNNPRLSYWSFSKFSHIFTLPSPVKISGEVGEVSESWFQAQLRIQSLIYFSRPAVAPAVRFNTEPVQNFWGENEPSFLEMGDRTISNFGKTYIPRQCSPSMCLVRYVASFRKSPSKPKIRPNVEIFDFPAKTGGWVSEVSQSERISSLQSSSPKVEVLDFRQVPPF